METGLDHIIEIVCPHCNVAHQRSVRWFFLNRSCPRCSGDIAPRVQSVLEDLRDAHQAFRQRKES